MIDVKAIEQILARGNTAEVKKRRDEIIVMEVKKQIRSSGKTVSGKG